MRAHLENKTALITGASRGLGKYIARNFWDAGASLILIARSFAKLSELRAELVTHTNPYQTIRLIESDLSDTIQLTSLINTITSLEEVHILVNNAAIQGPIGPVWENDWQSWESALQVNLLTPIALCRAVAPKMLQSGYGKIINLSGGGATNARPKFSSYAVAKAGLVRFSETLAEELKESNIDVNCIAPGMMNTDMLSDIIAAGAHAAGEQEFTQANHKKQAGHSVEQTAAELCVFLASPHSDGITGKLISAVWDPWRDLPSYASELKNSDIYTLRRITPRDRGKEWDASV